MQEVKDKDLSEKIASVFNMNCYFVNYPAENEGICVLSKYPVIKKDSWITDAKLKDKKSDYLFVMGDFNCGDNSDVIRMLLGECDVLIYSA